MATLLRAKSTAAPRTRSASAREIIAISVFGVAFLALMIAIAIKIPTPTAFQEFVFRIVLALVAAAIGGLIPGFLSVRVQWAHNNFIRATGALALFVIVYLVNPPKLITKSQNQSASLSVQSISVGFNRKSTHQLLVNVSVHKEGNAAKFAGYYSSRLVATDDARNPARIVDTLKSEVWKSASEGGAPVFDIEGNESLWFTVWGPVLTTNELEEFAAGRKALFFDARLVTVGSNARPLEICGFVVGGNLNAVQVCPAS